MGVPAMPFTARIGFWLDKGNVTTLGHHVIGVVFPRPEKQVSRVATWANVARMQYR